MSIMDNFGVRQTDCLKIGLFLTHFLLGEVVQSFLKVVRRLDKETRCFFSALQFSFFMGCLREKYKHNIYDPFLQTGTVAHQSFYLKKFWTHNVGNLKTHYLPISLISQEVKNNEGIKKPLYVTGHFSSMKKFPTTAVFLVFNYTPQFFHIYYI